MKGLKGLKFRAGGLNFRLQNPKAGLPGRGCDGVPAAAAAAPAPLLQFASPPHRRVAERLSLDTFALRACWTALFARMGALSLHHAAGPESPRRLPRACALCCARTSLLRPSRRVIVNYTHLVQGCLTPIPQTIIGMLAGNSTPFPCSGNCVYHL